MKTYCSPAKLNLFFRVLYKRSDGYHDIASLYQAIDLADEISLSLSKEDQFTCNREELHWNENNLVFKAVALFRKQTLIQDPVAIHLIKNIPIGGGLGGGSSNAATILFAMNELFSRPLSLEQLVIIGSKLGADVPFFFSSGSAYCTGIGEKIEMVPAPKMQSLYLISPSFSMSTPKVYQHCIPNEVSKEDPKTILTMFYHNNPYMVNDLEPSACRVDNRIMQIKHTLSPYGKVCMTGSGSSFMVQGKLPIQLLTDPRVFPVSFLTRDIQNNEWFIAKK